MPSPNPRLAALTDAEILSWLPATLQQFHKRLRLSHTTARDFLWRCVSRKLIMRVNVSSDLGWRAVFVPYDAATVVPALQTPHTRADWDPARERCACGSSHFRHAGTGVFCKMCGAPYVTPTAALVGAPRGARGWATPANITPPPYRRGYNWYVHR